MRQSNVPLGESLLVEAARAQLPPRWSTQLAAAGRQLPAKKEREDPLPWLRGLAAAVLAAAALEAVWLFGARLYRLARPATAGGKS
jgi:hypothetical protein